MLLAIALACAACACEGPPVTGQLVSSGGTLGGFVFQPRACVAGTTREFLGVDLWEGSTHARAFEDPIWGYTITYGPIAAPELILDQRSGCDTFVERIDFDRCGACGKNDTDRDDATVSGMVRLDCPTPGGGRLAGGVDFTDCYNPEEMQ